RRIDALAWAGDSQLFVVLPELDASDAGELLEPIAQAMAGLAANPRIGCATHPNDASDVDALLTSARQISLGTREKSTGPVPTRLRVGKHVVLFTDSGMARVYTLLEKLAAVGLPVLLTGETGTGKELAALALHDKSPRRAARFAAVNCAALPEA